MANYIQLTNWMSNWGSYMKGWPLFGFILLMAFVMVLKGISLWKSARFNQTAWFVILLIVNTMGILELVYIFFVARKKEKQQ